MFPSVSIYPSSSCSSINCFNLSLYLINHFNDIYYLLSIEGRMLKKIWEALSRAFYFVCVLSHVQLFVTLWTIDHQVPLSMGFPRQEYWNGLPFPAPGDLPNPGIKPSLLSLLHWQEDSLPSEPSGNHLVEHSRFQILLFVYRKKYVCLNMHLQYVCFYFYYI